jgi:putative FmdB family regulatory protein
MPLYDYDCAACGRRVEVVHGVHAPGPTHCPNCGSGPLRKAITAAAVHYKGSGWAKKERRASVTSGSAKATEDAATSTSDSDAKDAGATTSKPSSGSDTTATPAAPAAGKAAGAAAATKGE